MKRRPRPARKRKPRILWLRWLALLALLFLAQSVFPAQQPSGDEKFLMDAANRERAERGAPPLKWDSTLAEAAERHAREMAKRETISHRFPGEADLKDRARAAGARFSQVAENVAEAPDVSSIHINWMLSPGHSANILNPRLNSIGIAVEKRGEEYFAVQDFSTAVAALSREEQEREIASLLASRGLRVLKDSNEARQACARGAGTGGAHARAVVHFEAPNLRELPPQMIKMMGAGRFDSAAVGACDAKDEGAFTMFRIAVLFY